MTEKEHAPNLIHCSQCGTEAEPIVVRKGNMRTQIILWFAFILPGFLYSLWRESSKRNLCSVCGSTDVHSVCPLGDRAGDSAVVHQH